jgi:dolichol-phosphate mannosyltransferase
MSAVMFRERMGKVTTSIVVVRIISSARLLQFLKFCLVGGSGAVVDMAVLFCLADPTMLGWNITASKVCAAELALLNNFAWNELWTFRLAAGIARAGSWLRRLLIFNAICGAGIAIAAALLNAFHTSLGWNLYISNFLAITLVTLWNFGLNAKVNWNQHTTANLDQHGSPKLANEYWLEEAQ